MTSHSTERHKYTQLTDTIDKQTQTITQLADKLKRKVPVVTQSTKDVEEVTCRLEARAEVAKSEIQKCFPRILKALQDREKGMMAEVESMVQRKSKVLGLQQERLENELKRLTTTCNFTGEFNSSCNRSARRLYASKARNRDDAVLRALASHQCGPDSNLLARCHISVEFVVGSRVFL